MQMKTYFTWLRGMFCFLILGLGSLGPFASTAWGQMGTDGPWDNDASDPLYNDAPASSPSRRSIAADAVNLKHSKLTYDFLFRNDGPGTVTQLTVYFAIPENRDNQRLTNLSFSAPYSVLTDRYGQQVAHFQFNNLGAGQQVTVAWQADVEIWPVDYALDPTAVLGLEHVPADILSAYTTNESMYRLESAMIQNVAQVAAGGATHPYWIARNVHDFVANRLTYVNDHRWDDTETVYQQAHGSCTEYTWLFVALCRANGIPARYVGGSHHRQEGIYVDTVFHRWAEIYLPPYGWVPVDVTWDDSGDTLRHTYFGAVSDRCFVTTVSGGNADHLGWNYNYSYSYWRDGDITRVRERSFTWEPYPATLHITPTSLEGLVSPNTTAPVGSLAIVSTNGAYDWSLNAAPAWLNLTSSGTTPGTVAVVADTTNLNSGTYTETLNFRSESLDQEVRVPVHLVVMELIKVYLPLALRGD